MVYENRQRIIYVACDWLATSLAWFIFNVIRFYDLDGKAGFDTLSQFLQVQPVILGQLFFPLLMMAIYYFSGFYNHVAVKSRVEEFASTISSALIGTIAIYFVAIVDDPIPDRSSNYVLLIMLFGLLFGIVYAERLLITTRAHHSIASGKVKFNALIVGTSRQAQQIYKTLQSGRQAARSLYNVVGFVEIAPGNNDGTPPPPLPVYSLDDIAHVVSALNIKKLIVAPHRQGMSSTLSVINKLFPLGLPILISPTLLQLITSKPKISDMNGEMFIDISSANMSASTSNIKRAADLLVSAIALLLLSPVYAALAIAVKLNSDGPAFYCQERIGLHKRPFKIYKFRTMVVDAEANGPALSSSNDSRITSLGHFMRKYRLDELPQFWNVIKGDMSLVGPRPEREFYIKQIMKRAPYYMLIHQLRPGITSLGMVKYGYAENLSGMLKRLQYDIIYIENVSLTADLKIMLQTVSTIFKGKGL